MNVCLISREYPPFFGGGIGTYNVQWAKALAAAGHRVVVVTVSDDGVQRRETSDNLTVVRLPFLRGNDWSGPHPNIATPEVIAAYRGLGPVAAFAMQVEKTIPSLVREFNVDIIEAPDTGALAWFGLNNRRMGGTWSDVPPVVLTIHSPSAWIAHYNRQPLRGRADHELTSMERDCAYWCDALISPSMALAGWTRQNWDLPADAVDVIPYPLGDLESATATQVADPAGSGLRLLFIGRLEPRKGVDTLLEAVAALDLPGVTVDLVGEDIPDPARPGLFGQNSLRTLVPQARQSRVHILGRKSPAELPRLRNSADAIVIPSPMDNFPYVCVEAMAEGRLIVAANQGGTGEMIRDGLDGLLFDAGDAASLARALQRAAAMPQDARRAMRASAAARIRDYCGNQAILERRLNHYRRTIASPRPRDARPQADSIEVVNRGSTPAPVLDRLAAALRNADADFAHGWSRVDGKETVAFSTPGVRTLSMSPRAVGPIVVRSSVLASAPIKGLIHGEGAGLSTDSAWALALAMSAAGFKGLCVHDVVADVPADQMHPADRALWQELDAIHESKGWAMVNRVYDVLHVVRGRGLRRPYNGRRPK